MAPRTAESKSSLQPGQNPRRRARNTRRLALLAPTLSILAVDFALRGNSILAFRLYDHDATTLLGSVRGAHALAYGLFALVSALFWALLLLLASSARAKESPTPRRFVRHASAFLFLVLFTVSLGVEVAFRLAWNTYLSRDATELSIHPLRAALGSLRLGPTPVLCLLGSLLCALSLLWLSRRTVRVPRQTRKAATRLAPLVLLGVFFLPVSYRQYHATTPDLLWMNAISVMLRMAPERAVGESSMQLRSPPRLDPLEAKPTRPRNVVLILQESVRADVSCIEYDPACALATRATNLAAPDRLPFLEARSNGSATAIAMAVLFTGLDPTTPGERYHSAPTLFELAHAAHYDTAYLGAHHLLFANMWLWTMDVPSGNVVLGTHLDPQADMFTGARDDLLAERLKTFLPNLREPFFLVLHPSSIHTPRRGASIEGPFTPAIEDKSDREAYFNGYKNAVYNSDRAVAEMVRSLRAAPSGPRTVIVYTSDHGEAVWEHGQGCDHGCSLFDEEIHVPAWIDAPSGALSEGELSALRSAKNTRFFHVDLSATLLDLLGLWETPGFGAYKRFMIGQPLTRGAREERIVPLSNVSHIWERGAPSYGLMRGSKKLAAMHRHEGFSCWDLAQDPGETRDVMGECGELLETAMRVYGRPPRQFDKLVFHPEWGPFVGN